MPPADTEKSSQHAAPDARLASTYCGLEFSSPIVLLSGCVGFGEEYTRVVGFSNRDAGGSRAEGHDAATRASAIRAHRICETPMGMLNAIGLQNPGVER